MLTAKVTKSFDWMRVAVKDTNKVKLSLTMSRYRDSCSGTATEAQMRAAITAFGKIRDKKDFGTFEERIEAIKKVAEASQSIDAYIVGLQTLAA